MVTATACLPAGPCSALRMTEMWVDLAPILLAMMLSPARTLALIILLLGETWPAPGGTEWLWLLAVGLIGTIARISKNATVLVEDESGDFRLGDMCYSKYIVPLGELIKQKSNVRTKRFPGLPGPV